MIQFLILLALLVNTSPPLPDDSQGLFVAQNPLTFPSAMPTAAQIICDVLGEEISWRAGIADFLNNSTNLTNTELIIA